MKDKKEYTIDYHEPFYYLKERNKWWIFKYNEVIDYSHNLDDMEIKYMKLSGQEIKKTK